jgi:1D-myo-inositol-triphosphate 3-kinase
MQDLLYDFDNPSIMDIKIGTRSFIEDECSNNELRNDLYMKMMRISPDELTDEEHRVKAITKRRYMTWREQSTCSSTLGFRIEAIKKVSLARCYAHVGLYIKYDCALSCHKGNACT